MFLLLRDTSIYAVGDFFTKGISFIAIIFYSHMLSEAQIGVYGYILIIIGFVNTFLVVGMDNAYARFFFEAKTDEERQILTTTLISFVVILAFISVVFLSLFVSETTYTLFETHNYDLAFICALSTLPFKLFSALSNQTLRNQFQIHRFVIVNLLTAMLSVSLALVLLSTTMLHISAIFLGIIIAEFIIFPLRVFWLKPLWTHRFDTAILKKCLLYGLPFLPTSIAYWIFSSTDRVMLESMSSLESVGRYTVAFSLSAIMTLVSSAVSQSWSPHAFKIYEENPEEAKKLYRTFLTILLCVILGICFSVGLIGKEVLALCFPKNYESAFYPFMVLLLGTGFQITTQVTALGINLAHRTRHFIVLSSIVALCNITLNYILIPLWQELGAAIATALSFLLLTLSCAIISQRFFAISYNVISIIVFIIGITIIFYLSHISILYRFTIFGIVLLLALIGKDKIVKVLK